MSGPRERRIRRVLAKPLVNRGLKLQPGDTVDLRQEQIERLEPDGYFEPLKGAGIADKGGDK